MRVLVARHAPSSHASLALRASGRARIAGEGPHPSETPEAPAASPSAGRDTRPGRLRSAVEARLGAGAWVEAIERIPETQALVVLLEPSDAGRSAWLDDDDPIASALAAARSRGLPILVGLFEGAVVPAAPQLPQRCRSLVDAPTVDLSGGSSELLAVLDGLAREGSTLETASLPTLFSRRDPGPRQAAALRSGERARGGWDPILLKIAGTSGAAGLVLWGTFGLGPASLFLFLGTVSLLISRRDPPSQGRRAPGEAPTHRISRSDRRSAARPPREPPAGSGRGARP